MFIHISHTYIPHGYVDETTKGFSLRPGEICTVKLKERSLSDVVSMGRAFMLGSYCVFILGGSRYPVINDYRSRVFTNCCLYEIARPVTSIAGVVSFLSVYMYSQS